MGSEAAAYKEWERFMDHCARRVLEEHGEGFNQRRVPPKSIKKTPRKGIKKRGERKGRKKIVRVVKNDDADTKVAPRSRSRGGKRQKSKTTPVKSSSEDQAIAGPQKKRQRQRSVAFDKNDRDREQST